MLDRVRAIMTSGSDLLEAEAELVLVRARRLASGLLLAAAGLVLGLVGVLALLAAIAVGLTPIMGAGWALAAVGGPVAVLGLGGAWALMRKFSPDGEPTSEAAAEGRRDLARANFRASMADDEIDITADAPTPMSGFMESVLKDPMLAASGAFALAGLIGPLRIIRGLAKSAAVVGAATSVVGVLRSALEEMTPQDRSEGRADAHASPHV